MDLNAQSQAICVSTGNTVYLAERIMVWEKGQGKVARD